MKTPVKATKATKAAPATVAPPTKTTGKSKAAPAKATPPIKTTASKAVAAKATAAKSVIAPAPAKETETPPAAALKPAKVRKGSEKNYVAPPTAVLVQTSAKLMHQSSMAGIALNPAVIPAAIKKNAKLANNWKTKKPDELSDAEVIAMPDDEYMNKTQLAFFRFKLTSLRDAILASATLTTEHLRDDTVVVPDPTDRATIEEEHALELRTRDRERKLLKKIQQSIARLDQEDYGYCDETGEPIGVSRLIARPTATLSLEAQQRRELKQKMFGD